GPIRPTRRRANDAALIPRLTGRWRTEFPFPCAARFVFYLRAMPKPSVRARPSKALKPKYKRIVLKLSGEALKARGSQDNISPEIVQQICSQIKDVHDMGVEIAVVI